MAEARKIQDGPGNRPSLDALNRTIEGLESRLSEIMEARADPAAPRPATRRLPPLPGSDPSAMRDRESAQASSARLDGELRDISRTLHDLRANLREDFTAGVRDELSGVHDMLSQLQNQTDTREIDEDTRNELLRVSEGIDWLVDIAANDENGKLIEEFTHLQTLLRGLADTKSVERLENRFDGFERQLESLDPARFDSELALLTQGLDEIKRSLADNDPNRSLQDMEERLATLAHALETLCTRLPASSKRLDGQMNAIERRIADIDRNIERIGRRQGETVRDPALERMESRLGDLTNAIAAVDWQMRDQTTKQTAIVEGLETLAKRLEKRSDDDSHQKLEARLDKLASAIENFRPDVDRKVLEEAMSTLAERVCSQIDLTGAERRLSAKLESSVMDSSENRLRDELRARFENLPLKGDIDNLERRLVARMDPPATLRLNENDRRELNMQFEKLARLVESRKPGLEPRVLEEAFAAIGAQIANLDIHGAERRIMSKIEAMPASTISQSLENQIAALDPKAVESRLAERIDALDLSGMEKRLRDSIRTLDRSEAEERLSAQLAALARQLEETRHDDSRPALQRLENQIAELLTLANRPAAKPGFDGLEERLTTHIDTLSASNDDYIIEAAQHAADEALQKFQATHKGEMDAHIRMISALAEDLKALGKAGREGGPDLNATLKTIASRLETLPQQDDSATAKTEKKTEAVEKAPHTNTEANTPPVDTPRPAVTPTVNHSASSAPRMTQDTEKEKSEAEDIFSILSRVRASQPASPAATPSVLPVHARDLLYAPREKREPGKPAGVKNPALNARGPQGDLIAAARRAARSAVSNAEDMTPSVAGVQPSQKNDEDEEASPRNISRRPVFLAAGAILLAIMAYPLLTRSGSQNPVIFPPERPAIAQQPPLRQEPSDIAPPLDNVPVQQTAMASARNPSPSLRDPAPNRLETQPAVQQASAAGAFRMEATDREIVTGSIAPDATTGTTETASAAAPEPVSPKPEANDAAGPTAIEQSEAPSKATRSVPAEPAKVATVTTDDVLDVLASTPVPSKTGSDITAAKPASAPSSARAAGSDTPSIAADTQKPLSIAVSGNISPPALAEAARAGNPEALYEIGMRFEQGIGVTRDPARAFVWFSEAAERGSVPARFQLGSLYEKGSGVQQNLPKALALYRTAAQAGNISAMHNLAVMLANGSGENEPDFAGAAKWFTDAANHGVGDSQFNLAILYARGSGVERNLTQSYKWFAIAGANGDREAVKRRDEVAGTLSKEQLAAARDEVAAWTPEKPVPSANIVETPPQWMPVAASADKVDKTAVVRDIQSILNKNGYDAGPEDGLLGARTDAAIRAFQKVNGFKANGEITPQLVKALLASNSA